MLNRLAHIIDFYELLYELRDMNGGSRKLKDCDGRLSWPAKGVYFFFEDNEFRTDSGEGPRVTRIGTHALKKGAKTTLWKRLSQHRGVIKSGTGNHRGSIFRQLVGESILSKRKINNVVSWGVCSDVGKASVKLGLSRNEVKEMEKPIEIEVSNYIGDMPFVFLGVDDESGPESKRGYIERNSIALLSNWGKDNIDSPSISWLGHESGRERVRASGLWNNNHVDEAIDSEFVIKMKKCLGQ